MKKILIIKMRFPYPVFAGTDHVSYNLIKALSKDYEVSLICHVRSEENLRDVPELKKYCKEVITARYPSYSTFFQKLWKKIKREFLLFFYFVPRDVTDNVSSEIEKKIKSHLKENHYDIVQIEYFYAWKFVKYVKGSTSIMLSNDAYYETIRQIAKEEKSLIKKMIRYFEYIVTKRYELKAYKNFDWVFFISSKDLDIVKKSIKVEKFKVIPVAMDIDDGEEENDIEKDTMVFVGGMQAFFNRDAVLYFCRDIFPLVLRKKPNAKFVVLGSTEGTIIEKINFHRNVSIMGAVSDVKPYIKKSSIYVAPLRIGTGIKTKILEAMALGKAVVTTSIGVQGLDVRNGVNIFIENESRLFADRVIELLDNRELCEKVGKEARKYFKQNHSFESASKRILEVYKSI